MLGKNIAIKGIITTILLITLGFSQVSLEIKNVDLYDLGCTDPLYTMQSDCEAAASCECAPGSSASCDEDSSTKEACEEEKGTWSPKWFTGTLDIYMTNVAGCSYCTDATYPDKNGCLLYGSVNNNGVVDATWDFSSDIDKATCELEATNGVYFDGQVQGFQIGLSGVTVISASGGSSKTADFFMQVSESAVLGFTFGGAGIPAGEDTLTTISFSNFDGVGICLPYNQDGNPTSHTPVISDSDGKQLDAEVGDCECTGSECLSISQVGTALPAKFSISQNFPNPFNPVTSIAFDVAEMDEVSLIVYDLTGKEVATLVSGIYAPGTYNLEWNAVNNSGDGIVSGMYIYRYISSEKAITRKMLYLK